MSINIIFNLSKDGDCISLLIIPHGLPRYALYFCHSAKKIEHKTCHRIIFIHIVV